MDEITGLLGGLGNTDDIPALITSFATILTRIIEMVMNFFNSINGGSTPTTEATEPSSAE